MLHTGERCVEAHVSAHADETVTSSGMILCLMWGYYIIQIRPAAEEQSRLHGVLKETNNQAVSAGHDDDVSDAESWD